MIDIETNIAAIWQAIQQHNSARLELHHAPRLVVVSKRQSVNVIRRAIAVGQRDFGENYLQEAVAKIREIDDKSIVWHFIGSVQSNKTKIIAKYFDWVHSVDRLKIAQRLSKQRSSSMPPLNICLQVNIDKDPAKSGVNEQQALLLAREVAALPNLRLRGLMILPAHSGKVDQSFRAAQLLYQHLQQDLQMPNFDTLSMGMSSDYLQALDQGATLLRIGTAIFGARSS